MNKIKYIKSIEKVKYRTYRGVEKMTYKPIRCELTVLARSIYPAIKGTFTERNIFLTMIALSIPYYLLRYFASFWAGIIYISFLFVVLIWIIHDDCVKGYCTHEAYYRK